MSVNAIINGIEVKNMKLMNSLYDGFDPSTKRPFKAGTQIAFKHKDQLDKEQVDVIFPNGKIYNVTIVWPQEGVQAETKAPVKQAAIVPDDFEAFLSSADDNEEEEEEKEKEGFVEFEPSEYQKSILDVILQEKSHLLIEALAGAGKTSTLVWIVREISKLANKGKIIYLAFNKSIQEELVEKLEGTGVPALTTHSFGFGIVKSKYGRNITLNNNKCGDIFLKIMCDENGYQHSPEAFAVVRRSDEYLMRPAVLELVDKIKNWAIIPYHETSILKNKEQGMYRFSIGQKEDMRDLIAKYEIEFDRNKFMEDTIIDYACKVLANCIPLPGDGLAEIDFNDMLYIPIVLNLPVSKYDMVLCDESQDFSAAQRILLEKLMD